VPYLGAHGVTLARLVYDDASVPTVGGAHLHVFFELGDQLGSTSVVLDQATSELVERSTFEGYGATDSDYRPTRWKSFRADRRFTGKEEDVEVGLYYFGKRYLNPYLGRWVSADPLSVHSLGGDLNAYAYVHGELLRAVDVLGLEKTPPNGATVHTYTFGPGGKSQTTKVRRAQPKPASKSGGSSAGNKDDPLNMFNGGDPTPANPGAGVKGPGGKPQGSGSGNGSEPGDMPGAGNGQGNGNKPGGCHGIECSGYGTRKTDTVFDQLMLGFGFMMGMEPGRGGESGGMPGGHGPAGGGSVIGQLAVMLGAVLTQEAGEIGDAIEEGLRALKGEAEGAAEGLRRPYIRKGTRAEVDARAPRDASGRPIDPNTGAPIEGKPDLGHKPGHEFRSEKAAAEAQGLSQKEFNERMNNPDLYQLEDPSSNRSHRFERK
jgi:RHS repeat-associated protein